MKRLLLLMVSFLSLSMAFCQNSVEIQISSDSAKDKLIPGEFVKNGITYRNYKTHYVEVCGCDKSFETVEIPHTVPYNGKLYNVCRVADRAFLNHTRLRSITFYWTMGNYGVEVFKGCVNLDSVKVEDFPTNAQERSFIGCNATLYVDSHENVKRYRADKAWNVFKHIKYSRRYFMCLLNESNASFPGSGDSLSSFISKNSRYPIFDGKNGESWQDNSVRVIVTFTVHADGTVGDGKVVKSVNPELDMEALRIVSILPRWIPANCGGELIPQKFTMPINFRKDALTK
jgi:TonB family protein